MKSIRIVACLLVWIGLGTGNAVAQGRAAPVCDSSPRAVRQDEASLREALWESLSFLFDGTNSPRVGALASSIEIEYVGPGRIVPAPPDSLTLPSRGTPTGAPPARVDAWTGINPATCNQFRVRVPAAIGGLISTRARQKGLGRASPGPGPAAQRARDRLEPVEEQYGPPQTGDFFSGCQDTRMRVGTLSYPFRTVADFSPDGLFSSCTGTLVGPRHILTAAHCLYQGNGIWHDFTVIPGRDSFLWPFGSAHMSDTEGLNAGFRWYWIPGALADAQYPDWNSGLDIGIIVLPKRLGDTTGWMGVAVRSDSKLSAAWNLNKGYPGGSGLPIGFHLVQQLGAQYGDINACDVGDYSQPDAQGWHRLAGHSCDNSSGHSGGPIYHWLEDPATQHFVPAVSLIVTHHAAFASDFDCANNPRPYFATRMTPEYLDAFLFFRSWKP